MNDREKLIYLLKHSGCVIMCKAIDPKFDVLINWECIADHLIANGVVIRKQGEWICTDIFPWGKVYRCLECGCDVDVTQLTNYCPDCGVKMKGVQK